MELEKRRRKFPLNTGVQLDSKAVGRRRGAPRVPLLGTVVHARRGVRGPSLLSHALSQWYLSEWVVLPLPLGGTSQDGTVSSRVPLAGGIGEQQI